MPGHTVFFLLRVGCVGIGFWEVTLSRIIGFASFVEATATASLDLQFRVFGVVRGGISPHTAVPDSIFFICSTAFR